jgi:hypothetical protein
MLKQYDEFKTLPKEIKEESRVPINIDQGEEDSEMRLENVEVET